MSVYHIDAAVINDSEDWIQNPCILFDGLDDLAIIYLDAEKEDGSRYPLKVNEIRQMISEGYDSIVASAKADDAARSYLEAVPREKDKLLDSVDQPVFDQNGLDKLRKRVARSLGVVLRSVKKKIKRREAFSSLADAVTRGMCQRISSQYFIPQRILDFSENETGDSLSVPQDMEIDDLKQYLVTIQKQVQDHDIETLKSFIEDVFSNPPMYGAIYNRLAEDKDFLFEIKSYYQRIKSVENLVKSLQIEIERGESADLGSDDGESKPPASEMRPIVCKAPDFVSVDLPITTLRRLVFCYIFGNRSSDEILELMKSENSDISWNEDMIRLPESLINDVKSVIAAKNPSMIAAIDTLLSDFIVGVKLPVLMEEQPELEPGPDLDVESEIKLESEPEMDQDSDQVLDQDLESYLDSERGRELIANDNLLAAERMKAMLSGGGLAMPKKRKYTNRKPRVVSNQEPDEVKIYLKVGDNARYKKHGVCKVVAIEERDIAGKKEVFYVLEVIGSHDKQRIIVNVKIAEHEGLRRLISDEEINDIFDILRERIIAFDDVTWNRRYAKFNEKLKTGSIYDVAEVLRDLYRLKTDKQLSFGERRMLDRARKLIVLEIAIVRKQSDAEVQTEIEAIFFFD